MATTLQTRQSQVPTASGLNLIAGIWLVLSAFAVYAQRPMIMNNVVFGFAVVLLALFRTAGAYELGWLSWLNALIGTWVIVSPWALMGTGPNGPSHGMIINNCITGALIVFLGCWSAIATRYESRPAAAV